MQMRFHCLYNCKRYALVMHPDTLQDLGGSMVDCQMQAAITSYSVLTKLNLQAMPLPIHTTVHFVRYSIMCVIILITIDVLTIISCLCI